MSIKDKIPSEIMDIWEDTEALTFIASVGSGIVLVGGAFLFKKIYGGNPPELALLCLATLLCSIMVFIGLIMLLRREVPRYAFPPIKGTWAVIESVAVLIFWGIGLIVCFYQIVIILLHL